MPNLYALGRRAVLVGFASEPESRLSRSVRSNPPVLRRTSALPDVPVDQPLKTDTVSQEPFWTAGTQPWIPRFMKMDGTLTPPEFTTIAIVPYSKSLGSGR